MQVCLEGSKPRQHHHHHQQQQQQQQNQRQQQQQLQQQQQQEQQQQEQQMHQMDRPTSAQHKHQQHQQQQGMARSGRGGFCDVVVRASCSLHKGLPLTPLLLLPSMDCDELMAEYGPEALPWYRLMQPQQQQQQQNLQHESQQQQKQHTGLQEQSRSTPSAKANGVCRDPAPNLSSPQLHRQGSVQKAGSMNFSASYAHVGAAPAAAPAPAGERMAQAKATDAAGANKIAGAKGRTTPPLLYELYICAREDDALCLPKLELLAASGLGCVHYLTEDMESEWMVSSALKVCLADDRLLQHPLTRQCIAAHKALMQLPLQQQQQQQHTRSDATKEARSQGGANGSKGQQEQANRAARECREAGKAVGAGGEGNNSGAAGAASSAGMQFASDEDHACAVRAARQALLEGQRQFMALLTSQPDTHPDARGARKQLRQMVQEAHKNAHRRLRQLEVVHAHMGLQGPANSHTVAMQQHQQQQCCILGGSLALHEGVRLYLHAVCRVLDIWASALGLNSNRLGEGKGKGNKRAHPG
ncbi:hypothetical protein DUNSADRAFT_3333 [Dunaliella salina]|uniref:Uncharacterized protein n=1 Tax=Dunaliella salina TaxID=3046 RepID=A0ABQ7GUB1_DUNSA|nr:hypothetical protein DUNSADRAFT_3333 [Dunaliella salina]|eukprot:KAF5838138.1 hypothetical protein DUNSADRAFT_3333 [Dunaliella salina]